MKNTCLLFLLALLVGCVCPSRKSETGRMVVPKGQQWEYDVAEINSMPLKRAYLVPYSDSAGYVHQEVVMDDDYDRCVLLSDISDKEVSCFGWLYFDEKNRLRKYISVFWDGGDLCQDFYFNEQGQLVRGYVSNGDVALVRDKYVSRHRKEHEYDTDEAFWHQMVLHVDSLYRRDKVDNRLPKDCKQVNFEDLKAGDKVFLVGHQVYELPNSGALRKDFEGKPLDAYGYMCTVNIVANKWLKVSRWDDLVGYVKRDSVELIR